MEREIPSGYQPETKPRRLFPIQEHAISGALSVVEHSFDQPGHNARRRIEKSDQLIADYFANMNDLRSITQFNDQELVQYPRGFLFGMILLGFQSKIYTDGNVVVNPSAMEAYFSNLLVEEADSKTDPVYETLIANQPFDDEAFITPSSYLAMLTLYSDDEVMKKSIKTFTDNSYERFQLLLQQEDQLSAELPTIRNTVKEGLAGFNMGFTDYYWPIHYQHVMSKYVEVAEDYKRRTIEDF